MRSMVSGAVATKSLICSASTVPMAKPNPETPAMMSRNMMPVPKPRRSPRLSRRFTDGSMAKLRNALINKMMKNERSDSMIPRP